MSRWRETRSGAPGWSSAADRDPKAAIHKRGKFRVKKRLNTRVFKPKRGKFAIPPTHGEE